MLDIVDCQIISSLVIVDVIIIAIDPITTIYK